MVRMMLALAVPGLVLLAAARPAAANDCRQFTPRVGIVISAQTVPPSRRQAEIHYSFRGKSECFDAVHLRFGLDGREPFVNREIRSGRNCGMTRNERPLPACVVKIGPVDPGATYKVALQECDKHDFSGDECSSWAYGTATVPRD